MDNKDSLTGLYNRDGFFDKVRNLLIADDAVKHRMLCFDIRNFKLVNSVFGSETGNQLLREIGARLSEQSDENSVCCRMESDRFCVFTREASAERFVDLMLDTTFRIEGNDTYPIHIYAGIYDVIDRTMPVSDMCDRARMALDTVRANRLSNVAVYEESMYQDLLIEHELSAELPAAIKEEQLKLYLQPQVDGSGHLLGAETLIRWDHPTRGLLMPGEFLHFFEQNYMVVSIDRYMWERACALMADWQKNTDDGRYLSINISPCDFECIDVYGTLTEMVKRYGVDRNRLRVEITETTIMQNPQQQIKLIGQLRQAGFYVEMDDFGSGYSSFSMLKDIQVDALKLDMKFLAKSRNEERGKKILKALVGLANDFGMRVIAEGVETEEQVNFLRGIGCNVFQGFYFSRPMSVEKFEEKYS